MSASTEQVRVPALAKFAIGGVSGTIAQFSTHPMDVVKISMQISHNSLRDTVLRLFHVHGIRGFYTGLTAAVLRQLTYTTTRLGLYNTLLDVAEEQLGRLNYATMISFGMAAGVMGSFVGTPADLVLVRMVADINLPPEKQKNYRNAVSGICDIWRTEGFFSLWRGMVPTMGRAAVVNGMQLGTYTRAKMMLQDTGYIQNDMLLQFVAAMMSSVATCCASIPVDVAKTRIQNWRHPTKPAGMILTIVNIAKTEGVLSLWRGFIPYYSRSAPNTVITMVCLDQLQQMYTKFFPVSS